jgi:hypothetical protein
MAVTPIRIVWSSTRLFSRKFPAALREDFLSRISHNSDSKIGKYLKNFFYAHKQRMAFTVTILQWTRNRPAKLVDTRYIDKYRKQANSIDKLVKFSLPPQERKKEKKDFHYKISTLQ